MFVCQSFFNFVRRALNESVLMLLQFRHLAIPSKVNLIEIFLFLCSLSYMHAAIIAERAPVFLSKTVTLIKNYGYDFFDIKNYLDRRMHNKLLISKLSEHVKLYLLSG